MLQPDWYATSFVLCGYNTVSYQQQINIDDDDDDDDDDGKLEIMQCTGDDAAADMCAGEVKVTSYLSLDDMLQHVQVILSYLLTFLLTD